jgi:hypothetical protein
MDALTIRNEHMKYRCYFIYVMCSASLYSWYNYSLFDPILNSFFTLYYQNCLLMLFYLLWDTYHMTLSTNRALLYRTDLIIHHAVSGVACSSLINNTALGFSNCLIMESISALNYVWRENPRALNIYRTFCILLIRIPMSLWYVNYYVPIIALPYLEENRTYNHYLYLRMIGYTPVFFICYDAHILWKIYKPKSKLIASSVSRDKIE